MNGLRETLGGNSEPPLPSVTLDASAQKAMEDRFQNFDCGEAKSVCCSGNRDDPEFLGNILVQIVSFTTHQIFFSFFF